MVGIGLFVVAAALMVFITSMSGIATAIHDGGAGPPGPEGRFEIRAYALSTTQPDTPTGGVYDLTAHVFTTAPTGNVTWYTEPQDIPQGQELWASIAPIVPARQFGMVTPTWATPFVTGLEGGATVAQVNALGMRVGHNETAITALTAQGQEVRAVLDAPNLRLFPETYRTAADIQGDHVMVFDNVEFAALGTATTVELIEVETATVVHNQAWTFVDADQELHFNINAQEASDIGLTGASDYVTFRAVFKASGAVVSVTENVIVPIDTTGAFPANRSQLYTPSNADRLAWLAPRIDAPFVTRSVAGIARTYRVTFDNPQTFGQVDVSVVVNGVTVLQPVTRAQLGGTVSFTVTQAQADTILSNIEATAAVMDVAIRVGTIGHVRIGVGVLP